MADAAWQVRVAGAGEEGAIARLLHDFNVEFGDPTPGVEVLERRVAALQEADQLTVLLGGEGPEGLAALRFRAGLWTAGEECYLAELYVVPARRREGLGRALLEATMEHARGRGCEHIELNTSESDLAARALYESAGFDCHEGRPGGPLCLYYERTL